MSASAITVSNLVAQPSLRGNVLTWDVSDPWPKDMHYSLDTVEVWASNTNDRTTATKVGEGRASFTHAGLIEEATWYYWVEARDRTSPVPNYGPWYPAGANSGVACRTLGQAGLAFVLANGKLVTSVAGNALTIAVKTAAGNDPSVSDPVYVAFRDATVSSGGYTVRSLTSATSLTISSGSTLGASNVTPFRLWVVLFDDAGTPRIAVINTFNGSQIGAIPEYGVSSAVAEGGAGAADSALVYYANAAITSKPFRILGPLDWNSGLTTAGLWAANPDSVRLFGAGFNLPGQIVQTQQTALIGPQTGTTTILPYDNTIPQNTEGAPYFGLQIQPSSPINLLEHELLVSCSYSVAAKVVAALFQDSGANAIASAPHHVDVADAPIQIELRWFMQAKTVSITNFSVRLGGSVAGTLSVNGSSGASSTLGGTIVSSYRIREIMV